ncbi:ABC transporter ATP-binding protein [Devosia pacifica]|uniref:ABC transporter ATP-binding protein n=1 Tax=Devosia pacifica TaxID=1335967 RepID=A0A918S5M3_9HYPH|nr:ABC transporter substrate-binding protein [Devosia pacifica]GHA21947.1 ABC transporter ATP-binding protein [Devosia pacifica]
MNITMRRRQFLMSCSALLAAGHLSPALAQDARLRLIFWGGQNRADRTYAVLDAYEAEHGVTIDGEFLSFSDYWAKVATQTAAGEAPDVLQMDGAGRYVAEYASRGAIAELDEFVGDVLKLNDFDVDQLEAGRVDGKLYAISLGANAAGLIANTSKFQQAGIELPGQQTTYDDLWDMREAFAAAGEDIAVITDASGSWSALENWLRQRGKSLYTAEGRMGFSVEDAAEWFALWQRMRDDGVCLSAELQALDTSPATSALTTGKVAMAAEFSNLLVAYQALNSDKLVLTNLPRIATDAPGGHYRRPSMFFSVSNNSSDKEAAARFVSYFVNDIEANRILNAERGIPCSAAVREGIASSMDEAGRAAVEYVGGLGPLLSPPPVTSPSGAGEINESILVLTSQEVAFGARSPEDAGAALVSAGNEALDRAG